MQQRPRVPDEVEADVAEGDVLLELGGAGDPHAELLGEHEGVVAEPHGVLRGIRRGDAARAGDAGASELLGEGELVDRDVAVRVEARGIRAGVVGAHRCFTPSLFV